MILAVANNYDFSKRSALFALPAFALLLKVLLGA